MWSVRCIGCGYTREPEYTDIFASLHINITAVTNYTIAQRSAFANFFSNKFYSQNDSKHVA